VLAVVEHKERRLIFADRAHTRREVDCRHIRQPQSIGNAWRHERRVADRPERHEYDTGRALLGDRAREFQRETGLADASRSEQRDEPRGRIRQPASKRLQVSLTTEKRREGQGQSAGTRFVGGRVVRGRSRASEKQIASWTGQIKGC
jgi:hypothetical protein